MGIKMTSDELLKEISENKESENWGKHEYNIFNACGIENQELVHSSFIANLLNPEGTHKQKNMFLESFLKTLEKKYPEIEIEIKNLKDEVFVKTEQKINNGRIDIWIKSKNKNAYLIIENKIFAKDQEIQLLRYRKYLDGKSEVHKEQRKGILLYLTLNGKTATNHSTLDKLEQNKLNGYYTISYFKTICNWLSPYKEDNNLPTRVKDAIKQYLELISFLNSKINLKNKLLPKIDKEIIESALKNKNNDKQTNDFLEYLKYSYDRQQKSGKD